MTVSNLWAFRPTLALLSALALSACSTITHTQSSLSSMEKGGMCVSCPCCAKMSEKMKTSDKKTSCCCSGMMSGKDGGSCCGSSNDKPMMCQPKN